MVRLCGCRRLVSCWWLVRFAGEFVFWVFWMLLVCVFLLVWLLMLLADCGLSLCLDLWLGYLLYLSLACFLRGLGLIALVY